MFEWIFGFVLSRFLSDGRYDCRVDILGRGITGKVHCLGFCGELSGDGVPFEERRNLEKKAGGDGHFID